MKTYKLIISTCVSCILFVGLFAGIWYANVEFNMYVQKISEKRQVVQFLEKNKASFELYKKILVKGSAEQDEIKKYVLSSNTSFSAISRIEVDMQRAGLATKERGGLSSVTAREDGELSKQGAREVVVQLDAEGSYQKINDYIKALSVLPYVSYVEKVDLQFIDKVQTTVSTEGPAVHASIYLVVIETVSGKTAK